MFKNIVIASAISLMSLSANAELLTFDDIAVNAGSYKELTSYQGYDFTGTGVMDKAYSATSGYGNGTISGKNVLFSYNESDITVTKTGGGLFDLSSAYMTAAWQNGLTINVGGWLNGQKVNSMDVVIDTLTPSSPLAFGFDGVDKITFTFVKAGIDQNLGGSGHYFAIDNLTLNPVAAVPEPSTYAMMFAGLSAIGLMVRRRKLAN